MPAFFLINTKTKFTFLYFFNSLVIYIMKRETWKFIIQTIIAILTAIVTPLGVTSCTK